MTMGFRARRALSFGLLAVLTAGLWACSNREPTPSEEFVAMIYLGVYGVEPGLEITADWAARLDQAPDKRLIAKDMAGTFLLSEEGMQANSTSQARAVALYRSFLNRSPNDGEIEYWAGLLDAGEQTMQGLVEQFGDSEEFGALLADYFGDTNAPALPDPGE